MKKYFKIGAVTGFAHPETLIVKDAAKYKATVVLKYNGVSVNLENSAKSLMELMLLRIKPGTTIEIAASGCDEYIALKTIEKSLSRNLYIESEKWRNSLTHCNEKCIC